MTVRMAEQALGAPLFDRSLRPIGLTEQGLVVVPVTDEDSERRVVVQWRPAQGRSRETVAVVVEALLAVPSPYLDERN